MATYDLTFPSGFDLADSVQPEPFMSGSDDKWYFTVYGKMHSGDPALSYVCRWKPGQAVVEFVPLEIYTSARGSPASDGARLWFMAHDKNKHLRLETVPDWTPAGGYAMAPGGSVRVFVDQDGFDDRRIIDLAAAGIPACSALNVRMALDAYAGVIFRCGPEVADPNLQAAAMLTCTGLGVENRAYESGVIGTAGSRKLLVATENGAIAKAFVDVLGWWG